MQTIWDVGMVDMFRCNLCNFLGDLRVFFCIHILLIFVLVLKIEILKYDIFEINY